MISRMLGFRAFSADAKRVLIAIFNFTAMGIQQVLFGLYLLRLGYGASYVGLLAGKLGCRVMMAAGICAIVIGQTGASLAVLLPESIRSASIVIAYAATGLSQLVATAAAVPLPVLVARKGHSLVVVVSSIGGAAGMLLIASMRSGLGASSGLMLGRFAFGILFTTFTVFAQEVVPERRRIVVSGALYLTGALESATSPPVTFLISRNAAIMNTTA